MTSKTLFADRKMSTKALLVAVHRWAEGSAGVASLELRRHAGFVSYKTPLALTGKLREGLVKVFNSGFLTGTIEMDGAHASGRRANEKRGRTLAQAANSRAGDLDLSALTVSARQQKRREAKKLAAAVTGGFALELGSRMPDDRRIVIVLRERANEAGRGARRTRVAVATGELPEVVAAIAETFVCIPESILATDTGTAYPVLGKQFQFHVQVNHSETLVGPEGQHNNNAESFGARRKRSEHGVYRNIEPKYLLDYAVEAAFREDFSKLGVGAMADFALHCALTAGLSEWWRGYSQGKHRDYEIHVPANRPAKRSGPPKGTKRTSGRNGRPPR